MANDNKCHCGAKAPWLLVARTVEYEYRFNFALKEVPGAQTVHWACCSDHLVDAIRNVKNRKAALDKRAAFKAKRGQEVLVTVRGPDE